MSFSRSIALLIPVCILLSSCCCCCPCGTKAERKRSADTDLGTFFCWYERDEDGHLREKCAEGEPSPEGLKNPLPGDCEGVEPPPIHCLEHVVCSDVRVLMNTTFGVFALKRCAGRRDGVLYTYDVWVPVSDPYIVVGGNGPEPQLERLFGPDPGLASDLHEAKCVARGQYCTTTRDIGGERHCRTMQLYTCTALDENRQTIQWNDWRDDGNEWVRCGDFEPAPAARDCPPEADPGS